MKRLITSLLTRQWIVSSVAGSICFAVYLTTMCKTVSFIDAGELASVAGVLGIAHPTGYPLFTLLSHLFLYVPIPAEEIVRLNLFSAVVVALGVGVFYNLLIATVQYAQPKKRKEGARDQDEGGTPRFAAIISALVLGLSTTVWSQSVAIEVYGLHIVLLLSTLYMFLEGLRIADHTAVAIPRQLVLAVFLLGLSFTNHMTTILILPALFFLFFRRFGVQRSSFVLSSKLMPFFALGLSPYIYLSVRAAAQPPMNWGYPAGLERFIWHISGKQYRSWMFSSSESAEKQLRYFFAHFPNEFNWVIIALLLYGLWRCFRSSRDLFWFLSIAFVSCLFYSINYDIHDIDSYFLLAYLVSAVFFFFGLTSFVEKARRSLSGMAFPVLAVLVWALPVSQFALNRSEVDESDNSLIADYTQNIFSSVEPNAVIITYQWDYFVASSQYFQLVRKQRPDLVIIDKELLRRSWYFIQLKNRYPWLMDRAKAKADAFLAELYKFEHDLPYDPRQIESRYVEMVNEIIESSMQDRPVYVGPEIEGEFGSQYQKIPAGLLFRLTRDAQSLDNKPIPAIYRHASIDTRLTRGLRSLYVRMLTSTGAYFFSKKQFSEADSCLQIAFVIDPSFLPARELREKLALARKGGTP
jgi:hypothetical protein